MTDPILKEIAQFKHPEMHKRRAPSPRAPYEHIWKLTFENGYHAELYCENAWICLTIRGPNGTKDFLYRGFKDIKRIIIETIYKDRPMELLKYQVFGK